MENSDYWDRVVRLSTDSYARFFRSERELLERHILPSDELLDVCCGRGRATQYFSGRRSLLTAIDNNPQAISYAVSNEEGRPEKVNFVLGDALHMPFGNSSFNQAICLASLVNFGSRKLDLLREISRVTRGKILISAYNEEALQERLKAYSWTDTPIKKVDEDGTVYFRFNGCGNVSEQFNREDLGSLAASAGLIVEEIRKEGIGYFCAFSKK